MKANAPFSFVHVYRKILDLLQFTQTPVTYAGIIFFFSASHLLCSLLMLAPLIYKEGAGIVQFLCITTLFLLI